MAGKGFVVPGVSGTVGTGTTSITSGTPAGLVNTQLVLDVVITKDTTAPTINFTTPASWTSEINRLGGGGTFGNGTGPTRCAVFSRVKDAGWTTVPAVTVTGGGTTGAGIAFGMLPGGGTSISVASTSGEYTGNGTSWSAVMDADPGIQEGDRIVIACGNQDEGPTWSAQSLSVPGCTLTPVWERSEAIESTTGNDMGGMVCEFYVKTGTSSGAATFTATCSAASRGPTVLVRLRDTGAPDGLIAGVEPEAACGFVGPIADGNGNLYRLVEEFLGPNLSIPELGNHPAMMKSTDGGVIWKRMDSANGPGYGVGSSFNDMESAWLVQRTGLKQIEVLWEKAESRWWGATFCTSDHATTPDTWVTASIGTSSGVETFPATIASESGIAGASLSDGTVRAFIRGQVQGGFESFSFRTKATTTWGAGTYITDGVNMTRPCAVTANSDIVYLFYRDDTNGQVRYRTINAAGTVGSSARVDSGGAGAAASGNYLNNVCPPVYYDDAGTPVVVVGFVNASDQFRTVEVRGGVVGSEQQVSADAVNVNPLDLGGSSTDSQGPSIALAVLGTTLYAFWCKKSDGDIYWASRANGGSWGSATLFRDTGTGNEGQWIYANAVSATKIGVTVDVGRHFDDDSTILYSELVAAGPALPPIIVMPPRRP